MLWSENYLGLAGTKAILHKPNNKIELNKLKMNYVDVVVLLTKILKLHKTPPPKAD